MDADLVPGDGLVDEPIDLEEDFNGDLDDLEDEIVNNFNANHQTCIFPSYEWPSDAEE